MKFLAILVFLALNALAAVATTSSANAGNEDLEDARLLVVKNILNNYLVESLDITVKYTIYNIGNSAALSVKLEDGNFPVDKFEYATGFSKMKWSRIPPASNVSHSLTVRPKMFGAFNITSAVVSYLPSDKTSRTQVGYSSDLGEVYIQKLKDYNRKFASHTIYWIMFGVMAMPAIFLPYFLWYSSQKKHNKSNKSKATASKSN